jgi:hypothetical protein
MIDLSGGALGGVCAQMELSAWGYGAGLQLWWVVGMLWCAAICCFAAGHLY